MMTNPKTNPQVDEFYAHAPKWQPELAQLRKIALACELTEELKWGQPCYTDQGKNILLISGFKEYCVISFFKGSLLQDKHGILSLPGQNTQSGRVIRFTQLHEIEEISSVIVAYIQEAREIEKAGLQVNYKEIQEYTLPEELIVKFEEDAELKIAFESLTPGRQKAYIIYFTAAKQSKSRASRIEQYKQRILNRKGMYDCVCGLSKKIPNCDGSHKYIQQ